MGRNISSNFSRGKKEKKTPDLEGIKKRKRNMRKNKMKKGQRRKERKKESNLNLKRRERNKA